MRGFRLIAAMLLLHGLPVHAADGDACSTTNNMPGLELGGVCTATSSPAYGDSCGATSYFDGASCTAYPSAGVGSACSVNGAQSSSHFFTGSACVVDYSNTGTSGACSSPKMWQKGVCTDAPSAPSVPQVPMQPSGSALGGAADSLGSPVMPGGGGGQQPICVNSSPLVGGAIFGVVVGSVLCYGTPASGSDTGIYAYTTQDNQSVGGGINTNTWNGVRARDFYADGDITARGTLNVYGGAQIYSPDGNSGVVVANNKVVTASTDGSNVAVHQVTPGQVQSSATDGIATTTQTLAATGSTTVSSSGATSSSLSLTPTESKLTVTNGVSSTTSTATTNNYVIAATSGSGTSKLTVDSSSIGLVTGSGTPLASNGMSGTTSGSGPGGIQVYQNTQTIGANSTIGNQLEGRQYQNKVNGNLFVDGNVYINGTLEYVSSNAATTTVTSNTGSSILGANMSTSGGTYTVMKGTNATHAAVDANGRISLVPGVSAHSSSAMTLTNGLGNTHGFIVNEQQATMSGGLNSSSMTLSDNGATFSNSATGSPVQVHGVMDGTADYDAVNVRQLRRTQSELSSGIAGIAAMANIPPVDQDKRFSLGAGVGHYMNSTSLAIGSSLRLTPSTVVRASVASSERGSSNSTTYGLGVGVSW